jgi:hypothetical protein
LGIACLPLVTQFPLLIWGAAAVVMIIYAMSLPERYEIACGAYAFAPVVTMAESGDYPGGGAGRAHLGDHRRRRLRCGCRLVAGSLAALVQQLAQIGVRYETIADTEYRFP